MIKVIYTKKVSHILWEMKIFNTDENVYSSVYANKKSDLLRHAKKNSYK